jgi:MEMO1 family protein
MKPVTNQVIRKTFGAGRWFPADGEVLGKMIDGFLGKASIPKVDGRIVSAIAPHAGYEYSGKVAGATFRAIKDNLRGTNAPETVVILGASHRTPIDGVAVMDGDAIETPLGITALDKAASEFLTNGRQRIRLNAAPHEGEHSAENEIPFVQRALPEAKLVIALIGDHRSDTLAQVVAGLKDLAKTKRIIVVASSDMLHSPDYELVSKTDRQMLKKVAELDTTGIIKEWSGDHQVFCGLLPVLAAMQFAEAQGCKAATILQYRNNGDDDPTSRGTWVVGYGAAVFAVP